MVLGSFLAGWSAGPIGTYLNRRWSMMLGVVLLVVSVTVMVATTSMGALYFARLLMGYGNGLVMAFTMVYVSEIAPSNLRGLSYGLTSGWITVGQATGTVRPAASPPLRRHPDWSLTDNS
jgi:MFS family permease